MRHFLYLFTTLLLMIACTSEDVMNTRMQAECEDAISYNEMYRIAEEQSVAYNHYRQIMELMGTQTRNGASDDVLVYPDYYGGAYINDDNKLVMLVKKESASTRAASNLTSQISDEVIVDECEYSYNELQEVVEIIVEKIEHNPSFVEEIGIGVFGITNNRNRVFVCLHDTTVDKVNLFRERITDSHIVLFERGTHVEEQVSQDSISERIVIPNDATQHAYMLTCGEKIRAIFSSKKYAIGSVGYRARDEFGDEGFVTAAHILYDSLGNFARMVAHSIDTTVIIGETSWDETVFFEDYSDAAFVRCTSDASVNVKLTNQLRNYVINFRDTISTEIFEPLEGYTIYMKGATSYPIASTYSRGTVISSSTKVAQMKYGRVMEVRNVIAASYVGRRGDSGGIVFALSKTNSSLNPNAYPQTVGIHKGIFTRNDSTLSIVMKAHDINQKLHLTRF